MTTPDLKTSVPRVPTRGLKIVLALAAVVLLAMLPLLNITIPVVLPGATYKPGTLQVLAVTLVMASLALSYHMVFGVAGLLSTLR